MGDEIQKKFSFDSVTLKKIAKGAFHAVKVSAILGLLDYLLVIAGQVESNNIFVIAGLAWFTQTGYQTFRQYIAGK